MLLALRKIWRLAVLMVVLTGVPRPVPAAGEYLFKNLDALHGLTSSQINSILKDSRGYIWLGTPAGLYRYDGYTFRLFQCNSQDGASLPDSYIKNIQETLEGTLWIETASGFCIYHPQTESFERDMKQVYARMGISGTPSVVYIDRHKNLWAAIPNKGVVAYNMQQQTSYEFGYTDDAHGVPQGTICSIGECQDGAVVVYDDGRLVCCDILHQQQTVWQTDHVARQHLRKTATLRVFADQTDLLWLYGQGTLFTYNKRTNTWDTTVGDHLGLTGTDTDHSVNGMAGDRKGNIWIGTDRSGLLRSHVNGHAMEPVRPQGPHLMPNLRENVAIQSIYIDDTDLLWVGTEKSGLAYFGDNIYKFQSELLGDVTALAQGKDGTVWYGTADHGVLGYDGPLASQKVTALALTPDGSIWVGSKQNGLTRIVNGSSTIYNTKRDKGKTIIDDHINALCTDKGGNLWIATNGGLQVFNSRMGSFSSYTRENGMLNTNNVTALCYGSNNRLLIGTGEGLVVLSLSTREKTVLTGNKTNLKPFTNNYVTQVYEDSRGLLWIGTREGVNILNLDTDDLTYLTEADGLCNNNICGIAEDKHHNVWVTTSNGVSRIVVQRNHEEGTFNYGLYNYNQSDGLQSDEFNVGSVLTKQDGTVVFGGLYGINWGRKTGKNEQATLPRVMLTQLFIGEEEVLTGMEYDGHVVLPLALNESWRIELKNSQNTFTIKFAAGNYNQSERLQFMYWMEGLDNDWRNGDALLHGVRFKNLGSGKYTLHVKAVSAGGAVSNQERTLEIVVERPWWLSWWMLTLYVIILIVALIVWRYGLKKFKAIWLRKKTVIDELKRQREAIKQASEELRMPMARMTTIIGDMSMREQTLEGREQLNSLHFQLLQLITRISEMQTMLENPMKNATATAKDKLELNDQGEMTIATADGHVNTQDIQPLRLEGMPRKFSIVFIDTNNDFLQFMRAHLCEVYDFHVYNNIKEALPDIETLDADIVVCKQDMGKASMTGSELCNQFKNSPHRSRTKFVLMTDSVLTQDEMAEQNITLAADDYLAKPFNVQEAVMRLNKLMGLAPLEFEQQFIEGKETRMLEGQNASMTTASMTFEEFTGRTGAESSAYPLAKPHTGQATGTHSMNTQMDQQLMRNVEQFVLQNMSRGQISLDEMASSMGMGRVPFFHKIRSITKKTPAEVIREIRLKHACTLLINTNINMSELAINVGFMTAENFINIFRDKFGMTPLEYRLKNKK